jgi:hypothetical protein
MEIEASTLMSSLTTIGEKPDEGWFKKIKSPIEKWLSLRSTISSEFLKNLKKLPGLLTELGKGLKGLSEDIKKLTQYWGKWDKLFTDAAKKIEEYKGAIISWAKKPGGWIQGGLATVAAIGAAWGLNQIGVSPQNLASTMLNFSESLWNFNFQYTDKQLLDQINSMIEGMYGTAGDFVGRSLAQLIVGGLTTPPKVQINVRGLALNWLINPEIRDDMLQSVSMFAQQGITLARNVLIRFALLKGRHALKEYWKVAPPAVKKAISGVWKDADKVITTWGNEGNKPWSIATHIEEKVEKIDDKKLQNFTENFLESFWDGFRDSVEYVYN